MVPMSPIVLPPGLLARSVLGESWQTWLDALPARAAAVLDEWGLRRDGEHAWHGHASLVLPVLDDGRPAVLKLAYDGDTESVDEPLALRTWDGAGAVRLLRADPRRRALLLERLERTDLAERWDVEACELVAGLYRQLHVPASPRFGDLADWVSPDLDRLARLPRSAPIPHRYVEQAVSTGRSLLADPPPARLLHADLHYGNVLAADREPWLAIDPKPVAGDPQFEPAPMLINRMQELGTGSLLREGLRQRFHTLIDAAGLDEERARDWVIVRMIINAGWTLADAERTGRGLDAADRSWITRCITVAKAVQD